MATIYDCVNQTNRELYQEIRKYYEEAYQCIDKALKLDESGKHQEVRKPINSVIPILIFFLNRP